MSKGKHIKGAGGGSSKGSSSSRTPVVDPDSIRSRAILSILDLLGEGQIKGLVNGDQSIFINGTSLGNEDGSKNFEGVTWDFRDGRQDQDPIAGFPTVSTPFNVGIQVKQGVPYTLTVSDSESDFVKVVVTIPALYSQDVNTGDIKGTAVEYQFMISNNNGPFVPVNLAGTTNGLVTINDKSRSKYQREHSIPLPKPGSNYRIRMMRITADSTSSYLANDTYIDSYYEILDNRLSYPNSVMCGIRINAEQLAENPSRSYLVDGLYVQVPTNYNPETRVYTGVWDGSFKIGYTNNPAWILRDLLLNKRYGLGEFVSPSQVNSAKLYTIARYCDGLVDDGAGGQEPRFTINTVIAARRDAYKVIQDICSVFRGMSYWAAGAIQVTQDSPADPQFLFTNANVVDGLFNRMSSARKDRHSVVHVQWNDPLDQYKQKIEYVEDKDLINKIGYRKTDTIAFGCTSRAQAHRVGLWILYTEAFETNVMTFEVGLEGVQCVPGDIVKVHDQYRAGKRVGGRLKASTKTGCTLDSTVQISTGSRISIKMPNGKFEEVAINEVGLQSSITFASPLSEVPKANATWIISEPNLVPELVRCVGVSQSETPGQFVISVVDHNPSKFASIEQGLNLEKLPTTILDPTTSAPESLKIEEFTYLVAPGQLGTKLIASWEGKSVQYFVSWRMNSGSGSSAWVQEIVTKPTFELLNVQAGAIYDFKVVGQSLTGKLSAELVGSYTTLGTMTPPQPPTDLTAVGDFRQIILNWVNSGDVDFDYVEIYENTVDDLSTAYYLDRTPSNTYTRTGIPGLMKYWYWVRTVNKRGMASDFNSTAGTSAIAGVITKTDLDEELSQPIEDISNIKEDQQAIADALAVAQDAINTAGVEIDQLQTDLASTQTDVANQVTAINSTVSGLQTQVTNNLNAANTAIGQVNSEITTIKNTATALQTQVTDNLNSVNSQITNLQDQITNAVDANQYNKNLAYTAGQFAYIGNSLYQAKIAVPAKADGTNAPPNATYWRDAGTVISSADGLAARVSTAETNIGTINNTLTSQASTISGIQTTLNGKADASALTALTTRVTNAENTITSQGNAITSLTSTVNGKADASALTALTTRVTAAEGTLTSQGNSITSVQATLGNIAGNGANLLPSQWSWLTSTTLPATPLNAGTAVAGVAVAGALSGFGYKFTSSSTSTGLFFMLSQSNNAAGYNINVEPGTYLISFYASAPAAASIRANLYDGTSRYSSTQALTTTRTRYSLPITVSASAKVAVTLYPNMSGTSGAEVTIDSVMLEKRIGENNAASPFVSGPTASEVTGLATAATALEARVTAAEGVNTSQATSITNLNTSLANKADASALTALTTRVTTAENTITSQGNSITSLNNSLAGKADVSALNALTTRVTSAEGTLTSQGTAITSVQATLGNIGGAGSNMLPAEYTAFASAAPATSTNPAYTVAVEADAAAFNGYGLKITTNNTTNATMYFVPSAGSSITYAHANMGFKRGKYLLSYYAKASVAGHTIAPFLKAISTDNSSVNSPIVSQQQALTTTWARYSAVIDMTSASMVGDLMMLCLQVNVSATSGRSFWLDKVMIEPMVGDNTVPSAFVLGNSFRQALNNATAVTSLDARVTAAEGVNTSQSTSITNLTNSLAGKADASALTALTTRVTAAEGVNTSQGDAITSLNNTVAGKADTSALTALTTRVTAAEGSISSQGSAITSLTAGLGNTSQENLLRNPDFNAAGDLVINNTAQFTMAYFDKTDAAAPAASPANRLLCMSKIGETTGWGGQALVFTNGSVRTAATPGEVLSVECQMFCENATTNAGRIAITYWINGSTSVNGNVRILGYNAAAGGWQKLSVQVTVPDQTTEISVYVVPDGPATVGFKMWVGNIKVTRQTAGERSLASAQQALDTRVTAAEGTITSQGSSITNLTNSLANKADASALTALTTRVTTAENTITSQGNSITSLNNTVAGKADTSALNALTTRVTAVEGVNTSQSTSLTQLTSVVGQQPDNLILKGTFEDGDIGPWTASPTISDVTHPAYAKAITFMANSFCGITRNVACAPGEMFDCSADVYNNDMTSGQTTRLQIQFYDKNIVSLGYFTAFFVSAGTNGWQSMSGRITAPAGAVAARFVIRHETTSATGKSYWCNIVARRVSAAENSTASAVTSLTTRVTAAENTITSQSTSITNLTASLNAIGGTGSNLMPAEYSAFTDTAPGLIFGSGITGGVEADSAAFSGYALKMNKASGTGTVYFAAGSTYAGSNIQVKQKKYIVSVFIKAATSGHQVKFGVRGIKADGTVTAFSYSGNITVTDTWARYSAVIDMTASLADKMCFVFDSKSGTGAYNVNTWVDKVMIEEQIGSSTEPSSFVPGNSAGQVAVQGAALSSLTTRVTTAEGTLVSQGNSITSLNNSVAGKADTSALNALTTRVTTAENTITSQGTSITSLTASLGNISGNGANLLPSQYSWLTSTTLPQTNGSATTVAGVAVTGSPSGFGYKMTSTSASTGCYLMLCPLNTAASHNIYLEAGTYIVSFWASSPATATLRIRVYGVTTSAYSVQTITLTPTRTRYSVTVTLGASATYAVLFYYNQSAISGTEVTADSVMIERQVGTGTTGSTFVAGPTASEVTGLATAQSALDARVTAAEGVNTSQATSITNLNTSLAGKADNSALTALTTRVTTAENTITSQGSAVTALQSTLGNIGGSGSNLNPSEYSVFGPNAPVIGAISTGLTYSVVADSATLGGYALKFATSNTTTSAAVYLHASNTISTVGSFPISYVPGKYILSFYAKASVAGHQARAYLRGLNSSNAAVNSLAPTFTLTTDWVRYSTVIDLAAATFSGSRMAVAFYPNHSGVSGRDIFFDRIMVEKQIADGTNPSVFDAGTSYTQAQAQATALSNLTTTVTSQGNSITALSTQVNTLQTDLNNTSASVSTTSTALATLDGKLSASWTQKVQVTSYGMAYTAGMGIGIQTTDQGITQSSIVFQADRIMMYNPSNDTGRYPFQIVNGIVYLDSAVIRGATITNAHIADGTITYAKIGAAQVGTMHVIDQTVTFAKIADLNVGTLKIAGRAVTIPAAAYTEGTILCQGALNVQNWTAVSGLGVNGSGSEAMLTLTAMVSQNTAAGYWRVRRSDGAILASGQIGYANYTFNTPCVSLSVSIMVAAAGYWAYYLDIAPWSNSVTYQNIYVANRGITYLEVMR